MSQALSLFSKDLTEIVATQGPSVVEVDAGHRRGASGLVWAAEGLILTAAHKLLRDEDIQVGLADGTRLPARLLGVDHSTDLGLLQVDRQDLRPVAFRTDTSPRVGELVLALARPGKTVRAALGILSTVSAGPWRGPGGASLERYIESDISGRAGFSGGLLVDAEGLGIGLNTGGLIRGASMTIPQATLARVVASIQAHGSVRRGFLGIAAQPILLEGAAKTVAASDRGLILVRIESGGPAERGGLLVGDVILSVDGQAVGDLRELLGVLDETRIGRAVPVRVLRAGATLELPITVEVRE